MPLHLYEFLDAMMPYIIGMSKIHYNFVMDIIERNGKIIVDLDKNEVFEDTEDKFQLPKKPKQYLIKNMDEIMYQLKKFQAEVPNDES